MAAKPNKPVPNKGKASNQRPAPKPAPAPDRAARAAPPPQQRAAPAPAPTAAEAPPPADREPGTALQTTRSAPVPDHLRGVMKDHVNRGLSKDQADNLIPLIFVLQTNSPQCNDRNPAYMEGADAGKIWLRMQPEPFVDGEEGIYFQPCSFSKSVIEWIPRDKGGGGGNGFVGRHDGIPADAEKVQDPANPRRTRFMSAEGNEYVEVREHAGIVHMGDMRFPYVLPMAGSNHSVSKGWMFRMNSQVVDGGSAPSFAKVYQLKTKYRTNAAGQNWFCWDVGGSEWVSLEDFHAGEQLATAFESGEKRAEDTADTGEGDGETIDNDDNSGDNNQGDQDGI